MLFADELATNDRYQEYKQVTGSARQAPAMDGEPRF